MSERDVLDLAAQALRGAHDGASADANATRARVLMSVHQKRRRKLLRWVFWPPFFTLALAGSAWAASSGNWVPLWRTMAAVIGLETSEREQPAPARALVAPKQTSTPPPAPAAPPEDPAPPPAMEPPPPPVALPVAPPAAEPAAPLPARRSRPPAPAALAPDPELRAFRAAHELHLAGSDPRVAIEAYEAYLAAFPEGRFGPEARYAAALEYIKLGDEARARAALQPFARGRYGGYRQKEAARLLEALR